MKKPKATYFTDPGHSWLAVKRSLLKKLSILNEISHFSFQKGQTVYLEEDGDVTRLYNAFKAYYGHNGDVKLDEMLSIKTNISRDKQSPIRSYARFSPNKVEKWIPGLKIQVFGKTYTVEEKIKNEAVVQDIQGTRYLLKGKALDTAVTINQ